MPSRPLNLSTRLQTLNTVLHSPDHQHVVAQELQAANGDWAKALVNLKDKLPSDVLQKLSFTHSLAEWSGDNVPVVKALAATADIASLRDVALGFNIEQLTALVDPQTVPVATTGATPDEKKGNYAVALRQKLFVAEPTAVLQKMVQDAEVPISDPTLRTGVTSFFNNQPAFNIRTTSVYTALQSPDALKGVADDKRLGVVAQLKALQRVQAISPVPEAIPVLIKANLTTAFGIGELPESTFLAAHGPALGENTARQVYTNAINVRIRNEHALMTMREAVRGSGLAIIDGQESKQDRLTRLQGVADQNAVPLNLDTLFGGMDQCECEDCTSVYSAASYFVELLQYLRNNNLDPTKPVQNGIANTPLEKLFWRRPDLGCLELTCANTNTILPYIDLANEVMESFIVHRSEYDASSNDPTQRQAKLEVFNVEDEASSELLAQPQHINYDAYGLLINAVYPFSLPYHQPIDAIRIFLKYLGTSRYELLDTYRSAFQPIADPAITPGEQVELTGLNQVMLDRAVDAEFLGMSQEEYVILTKEGFWPKHYFEITLHQSLMSDDDYQQRIGVRPVNEYYGYPTVPAMLSVVETEDPKVQGLTFVKKQFLPRTGIAYVDLVEMLKTQFINPDYPQGRALTLMESIRFSYRFMQTLVDTSSTDPRVRFAKLLFFLEIVQPWLIWINATLLHPNPCQPQQLEPPIEPENLLYWVYSSFEKIGQLIVLESGEGPQLPIEGQVIGDKDDHDVVVGTLHKDGTITDATGAVIGNVTFDGKVVGTDGKPFEDQFGGGTLPIRDESGHEIGAIEPPDGHLIGQLPGWADPGPLSWLPVRDTCDLDKVRLTHLDGTALSGPEYDRIQRFLRLWQKLGYTIDETDKALIGLSGTNGPTSTLSAITPDFLNQMVAVRKLLDSTGLPLAKLLAFWADIGTSGESSLYASLFLTHNLVSLDPVFQADPNGNYLTQPGKITDHVPVLMAALKLKAADITAIVSLRSLADSLTLANVSTLYRHGLLAKLLGVKVADLAEILNLFKASDPFQNAYQMLALLNAWGQMEDAGFTFRQLAYVIDDVDDPLHPLGATSNKILQISKTLCDGLNAVDLDHPDVPADQPDVATDDLIRSQGGLFFEAPVVEQILGLLEGTTVYTTSAPPGLTFANPANMPSKIKYNDQKAAGSPATIQVTGILTVAEVAMAKGLSTDLGWAGAIDQAGRQPQNFFNDTLFGIFDTVGKSLLLAGDIAPTDGSPAPADGHSAQDKRLCFLQQFLPFLRKQLYHRFIVDTLAGMASLPGNITDLLLSSVLVAGTPAQPAMDVLQEIKDDPAPPGTTGWNGNLIPSVDDFYTFAAISVDPNIPPPPLMLDDQPISFVQQQEDPAKVNSYVWSTTELSKNLLGGKFYSLQVTGLPISALCWKTATSPRAPIPSSALLPDYSVAGTKAAFSKFAKAALVVNGFNLNIDEITYLQGNANFASLDFNALTMEQWQRLQAHTQLRNSLPTLDTTLLDLFTWAEKPYAPALPPDPSQTIADATGWNQDNVRQLLVASHFDLQRPEAFSNEVSLLKVQTALTVAGKIGVDIDLLFVWAQPTSDFTTCHTIAEDIHNATRARFDEEDWEQVVKPLNDQLREDQKEALISYLLVLQDLIDWGVTDADGLFEFFLIDVQMQDCMQTSRIVQAIATVQLFVQRCFLGLEEKYGVPNGALDRDRWQWMQKYRVWEANRQVFLYPENWILPELRDDKSSFYKELESDLLQKDINTQTVQDALKNYLFKVDEVANMKVVGLFLEQAFDTAGNPVVGDTGKPLYLKLHVFSRTRNAPYLFYYRYFDIEESNWYPWENVQVDIPVYDAHAHAEGLAHETGLVQENGAYLVPVVWNKRLLILFPQFMQKPVTPSTDPPTDYWEIKMAWSEYRNGKWTPKQVSSTALASDTTYQRGVQSYAFVPRIDAVASGIWVEVFQPMSQHGAVPLSQPPALIGSFHFIGSQIIREDATGSGLSSELDFHYDGTKLYSLQASGSDAPQFLHGEPYVEDDVIMVLLHYFGVTVSFYHWFAHYLLSTLNTGTLDTLFAYFLSLWDRHLVGHAYMREAFGGYVGADSKKSYHELKSAYSLYNWEAAFHAPMLLVDRLLKSQQFDQALAMCHYVFDPGANGTDDKRFWQFPPFKGIDAQDVLEQLFLGLQPNTPDAANGQINEWRNNPFQPHAVARLRPSAYMKWVVMKYIEILIAYGDYYFLQNSLESIPLAIQCYVLAAHVYGPRGQKIPKRGKTLPETYNSLLDKWDAFGNAMVELELAFPFSNQTPFPIGASNGVVGLANVFGFATSLYFCIPDNPQLSGLRDTIDDRLFKIRHCQDINGVFRQLPLFEPPIDPGLLVQAAAQGLSLSSVLNDLNSPMPNYRFYYLMQKALEVCSEVKALGNAFLSIKEKGDAEALQLLRAQHESSIQTLVMEVKKQQVDEATKALEALQQSRKVPVYRLQHFLKLIGEDPGKVPGADTDFSELADTIETPVDDSGLKLIPYEKEEMDKAAEASDKQEDIGRMETYASIMNAIPQFHYPPSFTLFTLGGSNFGSVAEAIAKAGQVVVGNRTFSSTSAGRKAGFLRQLQDRVQQANIAGYEIKSIDKQITTQQIRINIANQEITNQQKQIDNAQVIEDFLSSKYTNQQLYSWMEGSIRTLYYQAYTLAYDLARKAEKVYRFERWPTTSTYPTFIQFGYWDAAHDGLLAGERMYIGLKQLEAAYQEKRGYDFEIVKQISLRQIDPISLLQLRETGTCEFSVAEVLFDMDFPGHYMRRIKSVALTIPCVVGPYTSVNCTLRLLEHKFRTSAIATTNKDDYPEQTDATDDRFSTVIVPISAIAVSMGQNDSGVFELNFRDERYIPFEGAGAISKWSLELPADFQQFDYDSITDVIMQLRYTAVDGGDKLKSVAAATVRDYIKKATELSQDEGLFALFDLKHDYANEWYKAMQPSTETSPRQMTLLNLNQRMPVFTRAYKIQTTDIYLVTPDISSTAVGFRLSRGLYDQPFGGGMVETMKVFVIEDTIPVDNWVLTIPDLTTEITNLWLVIRYVLN